MKKLILLIALVIPFVGCTENQRAKNWGGNTTIEVSANKKLVNLTWKNENLWVLTRDRKEGETAETYYFTEDSSFGLIQGVVTIREK